MFDWIVRDRASPPRRVHLGIAGRAKLRHEATDDSIEPRSVEKSGAHEIVESIDTIRCPVAICLDDEPSLAGLEANAKRVGGALGDRRRWRRGGGISFFCGGRGLRRLSPRRLRVTPPWGGGGGRPV